MSSVVALCNVLKSKCVFLHVHTEVLTYSEAVFTVSGIKVTSWFSALYANHAKGAMTSITNTPCPPRGKFSVVGVIYDGMFWLGSGATGQIIVVDKASN